ncbi:MAG: hypothetical protein ABUK20_02800 [Anaerolineales bacterium]|jgi:hypothetical protein
MIKNSSAVFAWIFFGLITASVTAAVIFDFFTRPAGDIFVLAEILFPLVPVTFAFVGALIISRQPRNVIGWLMMLPGVSLFVLVDAFLRPYLNGLLPPPEAPTLVFLLILWFSNWNWLLLVFPLMFIMVLFPTGRPLTPRWGWLIYFGLGIMVPFILFITFADSLAPGSGGVDWVFANPIGFLDVKWIEYVVAPFIFALPVWVILCVVSLLIRFRRSRAVEREQIKWLFYSAAIFAAFYVPTFIQSNFNSPDSLWNILFGIGMLTVPISIAIAILRYRLYDIDIIIRRTLVYGALTLLMALVYFGSVVLLQQAFRALTGQDSPVAIVISTLIIAALFNPLRGRVQEVIDRRFFRKKYDAEKIMASFGAGLREEVDLEDLQNQILIVVQETLQPEQVSLCLKPDASRISEQGQN